MLVIMENAGLNQAGAEKGPLGGTIVVEDQKKRWWNAMSR